MGLSGARPQFFTKSEQNMIGAPLAVLDLEICEIEQPNLSGVRKGTKFYLVGKIRLFVFLFRGAYRPPLEIDHLQIQF
jgi:hypothetical protein